jgi:hypothetical protein
MGEEGCAATGTKLFNLIHHPGKLDEVLMVSVLALGCSTSFTIQASWMGS